MTNRFVGLALALACGVTSAVAEQGRSPSGPARDNPADEAFASALRDMMTGINASAPTGETDQDFVRMMLSYHQGAIAIAKAELKYGQDEDLKVLARDIVTMHEKEIALIKAWEDRKRGGH